MELKYVPRVSVNELYTLGKASVEICMPFASDLKDDLPNAKERLKEYELGLQKDKELYVKKTVLDNRRDRPVVGFKYDVKAEEYYPHDDATKEALRLLKETFNKYGKNMNTLPFDEQTAAEQMFLKEVKQLDLSALNDTSVLKWIPLMEETNREYMRGTLESAGEKADQAAQLSATKLAPQLENALDGLYRRMFANAVLGDNPKIVKAYEKLSVLIDSFK